MKKLTTKVDEELHDKILRYSSLKKLYNTSQAIRDLITHGLDVTANETEILKQIKSLKADVRDTQNILNKITETLFSSNRERYDALNEMLNEQRAKIDETNFLFFQFIEIVSQKTEEESSRIDIKLNQVLTSIEDMKNQNSKTWWGSK